MNFPPNLLYVAVNIVLVLGKEKAIELYDETRKVEHDGGMLLMVSCFD